MSRHMFEQSSIHSFRELFSYSPTYTLTRSLTHSLTHSPTHSLTQPRFYHCTVANGQTYIALGGLSFGLISVWDWHASTSDEQRAASPFLRGQHMTTLKFVVAQPGMHWVLQKSFRHWCTITSILPLRNAYLILALEQQPQIHTTTMQSCCLSSI